jgi:hypothetical protein
MLNLIKIPSPLQVKSSETVGGSTTQPPKPSASSVATIVQETLRKIKEHLAPLQKKMALYLVNPDTQFILYRPIKVSFMPA